jgi:hypothetical protein
MAENISKAIKDHDIVIFILPDKSHAETVLRIAKTMAENRDRTCYISLNKPYDTLVKDLQKNKIDDKKFFFIDCVGRGFVSGKNVMYVSSPKALTEMSITIKRGLEKESLKSVLFDSLSTLLVYEGSAIVIKFAHALMSGFRNDGVRAVFTCLKGDVETDLIKDLGMFVDKVMEL